MLLSIIIISFNTSQLLQSCLQSVYQALKKGNLEDSSEVIVVDNASTDNSVEVVRNNFSQTNLICNRKNLGFAKGNNQGMQKSKGKYVLLLNSDTELAADTLAVLLKEAESDKKTGVLGVKLLNRDGSLQPSAGFFPDLHKIFFWMTFVDDLPLLSNILKPYHQQNPKFYKKAQNIDWVSGACFLVRREAILKAGFLDEKIFMYGEEVEWCYRIKKSGFSVRYTPDTSIYHHKGASGEGKEAGICEEFSYLKYFYHKHKPYWQLIFLKLFLMIGAMLRILVFGIIGGNSKKVNLYAKAFNLA
ncbi:glycosyltransferase family 2 protein [Candidatus Gottesmanbacteria bacterium]|nr:glycosyltransferase family 2 protein [Candidatus Gottesmanbacteria bacterium]